MSQKQIKKQRQYLRRLGRQIGEENRRKMLEQEAEHNRKISEFEAEHKKKLSEYEANLNKLVNMLRIGSWKNRIKVAYYILARKNRIIMLKDGYVVSEAIQDQVVNKFFTSFSKNPKEVRHAN